MWPASPTPALRQGTPQTHTRNCGNQSAHQSLITDVYRPCLLPSALIRTDHRRTRMKTHGLAVENGHQSVDAAGVSRKWGDEERSDMTGRIVAGWEIVNGVGFAVGRNRHG
jgi:hypothetical protein